MNFAASVPEPVLITLRTFEKLICLEEERQRELVAEISVLDLKRRIVGTAQDVRWIVDRFLEPRHEELRASERRIAIVRGKLQQLQQEWATRRFNAPVPATDPDAPEVVFLTA